MGEFFFLVVFVFLMISGLILVASIMVWISDHIINTWIMLFTMAAISSLLAVSIGEILAVVFEGDPPQKDCTTYLDENGNEDYEVCMIEGSWEEYERDHEPR